MFLILQHSYEFDYLNVQGRGSNASVKADTAASPDSVTPESSQPGLEPGSSPYLGESVGSVGASRMTKTQI